MESNQSGGGSNRNLLIAIIVLLAALLVMLCILVAVLLFRSSDTPSTVSMETAAPETGAVTTIPDEDALIISDSPIETEMPVTTEISAESSDIVMETSEVLLDVRPIFRDVLQSIHDNHRYQDMVFESMNPDDMDIGQFAISDFDGDCKEELLVLWDDTYMAAMVGILYGVDDTGRVFEEFIGFPALTIYSNGIIMESISHNQGLAGDFWPYFVSRFDPVTDTYEDVGLIDAWDKKRAEVDFEGNKFPDDVDTSGSGFVYYINDPDYEKNGQPVDVTAYETWRQNLLKDADELTIDLKTITDQEIQAVVT